MLGLVKHAMRRPAKLSREVAAEREQPQPTSKSGLSALQGMVARGERRRGVEQEGFLRWPLGGETCQHVSTIATPTHHERQERLRKIRIAQDSA